MKMARLIDGTKKLQVVVVDVEVLGLLICEISFGRVRSFKKNFYFFLEAEQRWIQWSRWLKNMFDWFYRTIKSMEFHSNKKKLFNAIALLKGFFCHWCNQFMKWVKTFQMTCQEQVAEEAVAVNAYFISFCKRLCVDWPAHTFTLGSLFIFSRS